MLLQNITIYLVYTAVCGYCHRNAPLQYLAVALTLFPVRSLGSSEDSRRVSEPLPCLILFNMMGESGGGGARWAQELEPEAQGTFKPRSAHCDLLLHNRPRRDCMVRYMTNSIIMYHDVRSAYIYTKHGADATT